MNSKQTEEMDKVIKFLALELPEPVWNDVNKKWQGFKSGYAAAPQKGMRWVKASERLPEKEGLVHYHIENGLHDVCFYHKQRGFYKPKMVNPTSERMKLDRDLELIPLPYSLDKIYYLDESPSPSEAGDGWKAKYEKCIDIIKRFDAGIIGMYDL